MMMPPGHSDPGGMPQLVQVLPLALDLGPILEETRAVLISLELWTVFFELRYALLSPKSESVAFAESLGLNPGQDEEPSAQEIKSSILREAAGVPAVRVTWQVADDEETPYRLVASRGGGGRENWVGGCVFTPLPPPTVRTLVILARSQEGTVLARAEVPLTPNP
jgi:hypothetical protein